MFILCAVSKFTILVAGFIFKDEGDLFTCCKCRRFVKKNLPPDWKCIYVMWQQGAAVSGYNTKEVENLEVGFILVLVAAGK